MADSMRFMDWFKKAENDLHGAKILFQYEADYGIVAFHCQQTIEKALKGFILKFATELVEGHSLIYLCKRAICINDDFKQYLKDCAYVNQFYIETRYPADIVVELDKEDAQECLLIAEKLLQSVKETT